MPSTIKVLALSVLIAMGLVSSAEAGRVGGGRSVGASHMTSEPATAVAARLNSPTPLVPSASDRARVVTAAMAGAAAGSVARVAAADSQVAAPAGAERSAALAATEAKLKRLDQDAERERTGEAAARRASDRMSDRTLDSSANRPADKSADKPADQPVKTAAERRREQKEAEEKAVRERDEEARRVKLAREMSCRIEPVMSDAAIMNCREVWRTPS